MKKLQESRASLHSILQSIDDGVITFDQNGNVVFCNKAAGDLVGRSLAEVHGRPVQELFSVMETQAEKKFKRLIESLRDTYFLYSHDTQVRYTYVSPSMTDILGYSQEEFLRHHSEYLTDNPINSEAKRLTALGIQGIKQPPFEVEVFHKNGEILQLQINETPVFDAAGKVVAIEGLAHDITNVKKMEAQLRHAQKMEAIGTLSRGIAHDFNNFLTTILGYTELAKENAPPGSLFAEDLDKVLIATHRAMELVKQIYTFSPQQKETQRILLQVQPLLKEVLKFLRSSIPATIAIQEHIDPDCKEIEADPVQINQILMNLCTNAFHAMENTGGILSVELKNFHIEPGVHQKAVPLNPGEYVELTVSDSGTGIRPEIKDKIFDPYFSTKAAGKGTGLGLAAVRSIIDEYGGAVTVDSVYGHGATFCVYIPTIKRPAAPLENVSESIPTGQERILFVDDDELLAKMVKEMLEKLGYSVTACAASSEALEIFQAAPGKFDLVITDHVMPGITGYDLARQMLQIRPDVPIFLCTGYSSHLQEEQAKALGIKEYVLKPILRKDIARLIRKVLDGS